MRKILIIFLLISFTLQSHSETITFKNGKTIDAPVLERTEEYIKVDIEGVGIKYYVDEIVNSSDTGLNETEFIPT